jgi:hypothetical protein
VNDQTTGGRKGGEARPTPKLAEADAANRISHGFRDRVAESIDSTGKALAVLAGFGAFFIAAGYFVEWQRFRQGGLSPEEVLPLIPKDQIAAAGVRELVISVLFVGITIAFFGFVLVRVARWSQGKGGRLARALNRALAQDVVFPTFVVGLVTLLIVPLDGFGLLITAIVTGLFYYGLLLVRRFLETGDNTKFPLWRLALAVGLAAVVLAGARQEDFPERRADILVCLTNGDEFEGDYLASDSGKILIRKRRIAVGLFERRDRLTCANNRREENRKEKRRRQGVRPRLLVVPNEDVREIQVARASALLPYKRSLLDRAVSLLPGIPALEFSCIPPECRWGGETRIGPSSYL